ncbi:hypothetical protein O181_064439 [Austropuccinia psidii MF-1]|uniref:Reverse transcriptase domain-containing protein n=1 Tax=Austropuccinia psidii MF-1 TaxID=1389203 RepID=A0A9Q3I3I6_9BASI|nr:hypothetical protein [Austropuccinia psidii MF-1]
MGGQRGHNINDTLVLFMTWIKAKWREGKTVTGVFLDVKSAYPTVNKERLLNTLCSKGAPPYLINVIVSFLSDRHTKVKLNDFVSNNFPIEQGLSQGSPLSVTLYLIYNSSLLLPRPPTLEEDQISIAYIDNVVHLTASKCHDRLLKSIEEVITHSLRWGTQHGAIFDEKKTNILWFMKKKTTHTEIRLTDKTLKFQQMTKWLGIHLDSKLNFGNHIWQHKKTCSLTMNKLRQIIKTTYGLNPREARQLVLGVLFPRLLFGSISWFTKRNKKTVERWLDKVHNEAVRLITGMMTQTPTQLVAQDSHPIKRIIQKELFDDIKHFRSPIHKILQKEHLRELHNTPLEIRMQQAIPPWADPLPTPRNLNTSKEEVAKKIKTQLQEEANNNSLIMFTDGSLIEGRKAGAAVYAPHTHLTLKSHLGQGDAKSGSDQMEWPGDLLRQPRGAEGHMQT